MDSSVIFQLTGLNYEGLFKMLFSPVFNVYVLGMSFYIISGAKIEVRYLFLYCVLDQFYAVEST